MSVRESYNQWSATYDEVENKTRDLEKIAGQEILKNIQAETILELGCGTGKNTEWLSAKTNHLIAVDVSEEMLAKAKEKIRSSNVSFHQADITQPWTFTSSTADLITCSLILEHIEGLDKVFANVSHQLTANGHFYVCELHPFRQYNGSKARFETETGTQVLDCFNHHISDYLQAAENAGLELLQLNEWFDDNDRTSVPRLISFLFKKN